MSLTKGPLDVVSEPDRPARDDSGENCEIEIPAEVMERAINELFGFDVERHRPEEVVMRLLSILRPVLTK
jgi:hypothetical protein